jgi:hypothetical protein
MIGVRHYNEYVLHVKPQTQHEIDCLSDNPLGPASSFSFLNLELAAQYIYHILYCRSKIVSNFTYTICLGKAWLDQICTKN